jgi:hypothetical protein
VQELGLFSVTALMRPPYGDIPPGGILAYRRLHCLFWHCFPKGLPCPPHLVPTPVATLQRPASSHICKTFQACAGKLVDFNCECCGYSHSICGHNHGYSRHFKNSGPAVDCLSTQCDTDTQPYAQQKHTCRKPQTTPTRMTHVHIEVVYVGMRVACLGVLWSM